MPKTADDRLADVQQAVAQLREVTREAHEAAKAARHECAQALAAKRGLEDLVDGLAAVVTEAIRGHITEGLDAYNGAIAAAIETAEARVYKRFDDMVARLLGVEPGTEGETLEVMLERWMTQQRIMAGAGGLSTGLKSCPGCGAPRDEAHGPNCPFVQFVNARTRAHLDGG